MLFYPHLPIMRSSFFSFHMAKVIYINSNTNTRWHLLSPQLSRSCQRRRDVRSILLLRLMWRDSRFVQVWCDMNFLHKKCSMKTKTIFPHFPLRTHDPGEPSLGSVRSHSHIHTTSYKHTIFTHHRDGGCGCFYYKFTIFFIVLAKFLPIFTDFTSRF